MPCLHTILPDMETVYGVAANSFFGVSSEAVVQAGVRAEFFSWFGKVQFYRTLRLIHPRARTLTMDMVG